MRSMVAAKVADILRDNPDGISRPGLMAWARLRVAPDLTDEQLDAALAELGPAVSTEGGFIRLVARAALPGTGQAAPETHEPSPPNGAEPGSRVDRGQAIAGPGPSGPAEALDGPTPSAPATSPPGFSAASLVAEAAPAASTWVAGSRPPRYLRTLVTLLAVAAIGVFAVLGRSASDGSSVGASSLPSDPRGSIAGADELAVGTCFVVPVASEFSEIEVRPCDASHDGEVVAVWQYQATTGGTYPTDAEWRAAVEGRCEAGFESYTGRSYAAQSELTYGWFVPAEDAWRQGSRTVQCYLGPDGGAPLTRSFRAGS